MNGIVSASQDRTRGNLGIAVVAVIVAGLALMILLAACGSSPSEPTQAPAVDTAVPTEAPDVEGATLLETRCSTCHGVERATQLTKTVDEWEQTVTRMVGNGAQLTDAETSVLVEYLAENYGP
jgi:cytochrome c5